VAPAVSFARSASMLSLQAPPPCIGQSHRLQWCGFTTRRPIGEAFTWSRPHPSNTCSLTSKFLDGCLAVFVCNIFISSHRRVSRYPSRHARSFRKTSIVCHATPDTLGRAGLIRSWWPFPLRRLGSEGQGTLTLERGEDLDDGASPEEELRLLSQKGPQKIAMLGTRECPFQHQQEIELLAEARVMRGDHIYTSGSNGTNSSVIRGALKARKPRLLTVILPQSYRKQDSDSQLLLRECMNRGVRVQAMSENDKLSLNQAAQLCNTKILGQVKRLIAFASHESSNYLSLVEQAHKNGIVATAFFLD